MKLLVKTPSGQDAFKTRSSLLSVRQRSAFLMFDGVKSVDQVLAATSGLGITMGDIDYFCQQGFLMPVSAAKGHAPQGAPVSLVEAGSGGKSALAQGTSARTPQERYSMAMPLATKATASLGLRGFMLNLAVESAAGLDDLMALFPKIQSAVGREACADLERALKG